MSGSAVSVIAHDAPAFFTRAQIAFGTLPTLHLKSKELFPEG
jgi:hypothetical protein